MSDKTLTMTVIAVEPIPGTFPIELHGAGLHYLEGPPEAGKSNLLDTILFGYYRATGGNPKQDRYRVSISFEARERAQQAGAEAVGQVTLPGMGGQPAGVKIYESQIRRLPAPPTVQILDGSPFVQLTRSGLTEPKTRQAAELKAFAAITQVRARPSDLVPEDMAADVAHLDLPDAELLPDIADSVRRCLHVLKGRHEDDAAALERKLNVCRDQADKEVVESDVGTVANEQARLEQAESQSYETRIARRARERAETTVAQFRTSHPAQRPDGVAIRARLGEARAQLDAEIDQASEGLAPEPNVEGARATMLYLSGTRNQTLACLQDVEEELRQLLQRKAGLEASLKEQNEQAEQSAAAFAATKDAHVAWTVQKAAHDERKSRVIAAQRAIDDLEAQARQVEAAGRQWDERQAVIDAPIEGPEAEAVQAAVDAVTAQRARVEMARRKEAEDKRQDEEYVLDNKHRAELAQAKAYELAATTGLKSRIGALLSARRIDGWAIEDGVLMAHSPRAGKMVPFADLSRSTQDTAALRLYLEQMPVDPSAEYHLVLVPQEALDGTTEAQRAELSRIAQEAGRYLLSARVSESGDLRVVKVEVARQAQAA